jgi:hypothetical protein
MFFSYMFVLSHFIVFLVFVNMYYYFKKRVS